MPTDTTRPNASESLVPRASDAALALDRFHRPIPAAPLLKRSTYFSGQWLIALSIGVGEAIVDWIIR